MGHAMIFKHVALGAAVLAPGAYLLGPTAGNVIRGIASNSHPERLPFGISSTTMDFLQTPFPTGIKRGQNLLEKVALPPKGIVTEFFTKECFRRADESDDALFYAQPRLVTHIDDMAIQALHEHYASVLSTGGEHLDVCSSWVSFLPESYVPSRCVGLGMNEVELAANKQLSEFIVQDLNIEPYLPFEDDSFDAVTNVVSIDYLIHPIQLMAEQKRVLRPGGIAICSFSNRMFWTKAVEVWTRS